MAEDCGVTEQEPPKSDKKEATPEELMARCDEIGNQLRRLIVDCKRLSKLDPSDMEPYQPRKRALKMAQDHLQTGLLWLRRCISGDAKF